MPGRERVLPADVNPAPLIDAVNFRQIDAGKWNSSRNPEYLRVLDLKDQLDIILGHWNGIINADAANPAAVTAAFNNLKNGPKIVNLESGVFLGGKSRHKNKKNNKSRRRNQSKKQRK
jgi:hypothetical protein